jgi:hypothetical protein
MREHSQNPKEEVLGLFVGSSQILRNWFLETKRHSNGLAFIPVSRIYTSRFEKLLLYLTKIIFI